MALVLACFLIGAWLGVRFKVAVLVPATFAVIILSWCVGLPDGQSYSLLIVTQIAAVAAIQAGYLASYLLDARIARARDKTASAIVARDLG